MTVLATLLLTALAELVIIGGLVRFAARLHADRSEAWRELRWGGCGGFAPRKKLRVIK